MIKCERFRKSQVKKHWKSIKFIEKCVPLIAEQNKSIEKDFFKLFSSYAIFKSICFNSTCGIFLLFFFLLRFMFGCQIKTKCWLGVISGYMCQRGGQWRLTNFNGHSNGTTKQKKKRPIESIIKQTLESNYGWAVINFLAFHFLKWDFEENEKSRDLKEKIAIHTKQQSNLSFIYWMIA